MEIELAACGGPSLVMGYDWERHGGSGDRQSDLRDWKWSEAGVRAVLGAHRDFGVPLTFFVLTRILDVSSLKELVMEAAADPLVEIAQHGHSHLLVQPLQVVDRVPVSSEEYLEDVSDAQSRLAGIGFSPSGFRTPLGYYRGLQESPAVVEGLKSMGMSYVSSDCRNSDHSFPAPWRMPGGGFRQPYFYRPAGLLEIPVHGIADI
jgi:peptidoglycan/xylan/chitin deacetylase (PgdA/CDA1 family)